MAACKEDGEIVELYGCDGFAAKLAKYALLSESDESETNAGLDGRPINNHQTDESSATTYSIAM